MLLLFSSVPVCTCGAVDVTARIIILNLGSKKFNVSPKWQTVVMTVVVAITG